MERYDHSNLQVGDAACYGSLSGYGYTRWVVTHTAVEKLTATQIVMKNGKRFRRDNGRAIGETSSGYGRRVSKLLDPKGKEVAEAWAFDEAERVRQTLAELAKMKVTGAGTLGEYYAHIQGVVNQAQQRRTAWVEANK